MLHQEALVDFSAPIDDGLIAHVAHNRHDEHVPNLDDDINIFIEYEYEHDDPTKYEEIKKILADIDTPHPDWSDDDNKIITKFLHSVNE